MSLRLTEFLAKLSKYLDVSSEMQVGAIEFTCARKGRIDIKLFCQLYGLRYKQTLDLVGRLHRRGLVKKDGTGVYVLTEKRLRGMPPDILPQQSSNPQNHKAPHGARDEAEWQTSPQVSYEAWRMQ